MVIRTLIVNTMPRRSAEDIVTQQDGVLRVRDADVATPARGSWNPFQELEAGERRPRPTHPVMQDTDVETIPTGMEGNYYW